MTDIGRSVSARIGSKLLPFSLESMQKHCRLEDRIYTVDISENNTLGRFRVTDSRPIQALYSFDRLRIVLVSRFNFPSLVYPDDQPSYYAHGSACS
jgi:hypothetical protein